MFKFENGEVVKDVITGFKGVVMSRINYLTGCNQYGLSMMALTSDGKRADWEYFDENRLVSCKKSIKLPSTENLNNKGCDGNHPKDR